MKLLTQTLTKHLISISKPLFDKNNSDRELRIFINSFPASVVAAVGQNYNNYLASKGPKTELIYKVGKVLWESWQPGDGPGQSSALETIKSEDWVDFADRLTFYRDRKWRPDSGYASLVVILFGVEKATDEASLQDFYRVDYHTLWRTELQGSFKQWLEETLHSKGISPEKEHIERMDELLQILFKKGIGDLVQISNFLETQPFETAQDGMDAISALYMGLPFWGLPPLEDLPANSRKWPKYVAAAIDFFSYQKYLKISERKKANQKLDLYNKDGEPLLGEGEFSGKSDLIQTLRAYVDRNDLSAKKRLGKFDFVFIADNILDLKKRKKTGPKKTQNIDAAPGEALMKAVWLTLIEFKHNCLKQWKTPGELLSGIEIAPIKFRHDLGDREEAKSLYLGCFGGVDKFIEQYLQIDLVLDEEEKVIPVQCRMCEEFENLRLERTGSGRPGVQFKVTLDVEGGKNLSRTFQWLVPETQPYRNLWNLARAVFKEMKSPGLPVFHAPHFEEFFLAADEDEANRLLKLNIGKLKARDLLKAPGLDRSDPLWPEFSDLAKVYHDFLKIYVNDGYFAAMAGGWRKTYIAVTRCFEKLLKIQGGAQDHPLCPFLYKAFALIQNEPGGNPWDSLWTGYLKSAVITGLHPSLLEMMHHRDVFLAHGFAWKVKDALEDGTGRKMTAQEWDEVSDLAAIHYPLYGVVSNNNKDLSTQTKSFNLIHCLGEPKKTKSLLSTKILLRYDVSEDEDITDADMFRESRESRVIERILKEYTKLHLHARDGLTVSILSAESPQTIIAGIDSFLRIHLKDTGHVDHEVKPPYHLSLILFLNSGNNQMVTRWLEEWQKRWNISSNTKKFAYYERCRLSVSKRIADTPSDYLDILSKPDFDVDIAMVPHFISAGHQGNDVKPAKPYRLDLENPLKFPFVEMLQCIDKSPVRALERSRIISNRQFRIATLHSELSARLKHPIDSAEQEHLVVSLSDYKPWQGIIDRLHKKASWVMCLDAAMDEQLIQAKHNASDFPREIIGFAAGLGAHGELNYTVSTERSSLSEIESRIGVQVKDLLPEMSAEDAVKAAHLLVNRSRELSGLSLVRAIGPSRYIHDLMAYTLVRICLPPLKVEGEMLCDELIALDTFAHWFLGAKDGMRPDLMRLVATRTQKGNIHLFAQILECKLGKQSIAHVEKARQQLESGMRHLMTVFQPRLEGVTSNYDQRYWWAQIQRLVASKSHVTNSVLIETTAALERLAEGYFEISWQGAAVTFWLDESEPEFVKDTEWPFQFQATSLGLHHISCGIGLLKRVCCQGEEVPLVLGDNWFKQGELQGDMASLSDEKSTHEALDKPKKEDAEKQEHEKPYEIEGVVPPKTSDGDVEFREERSETPTPQQIYLGDNKAGRQIYWEFGHSELPNRHFLIFGRSGTGKTYAIQAILCELAGQQQNSLIVDYTSGFEKSQLETETKAILKPKQHFVRMEPLPINPFRKQVTYIDDQDIPEKAIDTSNRVMSVFDSVYKLGEQQKSTLYQAGKRGLELFKEAMDLEKLVEILEQFKRDGENKDSTISILNKIRPFVDGEPFGEEDALGWKRFFDDKNHLSHIIQLAGTSRDFSSLVTEFVLIDLYWFARGTGNEKNPKVVVLDEIQNLDHRLESPIAKFLTEGRKFGLSMILATQTLSNLKREERDRLFQASHKLFFKPADTELQEYAQILERGTGENANIWVRRLADLKKGECYSLGPSVNSGNQKLEEKAFPIRITALGDRIQRIREKAES